MNKLQHMVDLTARALIEPQRGYITLYYDRQYDIGKITLSNCSREELIAVAHSLGTARKEFYGDQFWLEGELEGIKILAHGSREQVCRKTVTGTRFVPAQMIPAREEEIVEWECEPLLAEMR